MNGLTLDDEKPYLVIEKRTCLATPYVSSSDFQASVVFEKLKLLIKDLRMQYTEEIFSNHDETVASQTMEVVPCRYFMSGLCARGENCFFSHSAQAKRPMCKFFLTLKGCRNGASCSFSHDYSPSVAGIIAPIACSQENEIASAHSFLQLLPGTGSGCVLLLNDKDLKFTSSLSRHYDASKMIVTTPHDYSSHLAASSNGVKVLWGVSNPSKLIIETEGAPISWREVQSVLWFAETVENDSNIQPHLIRNFFGFLAIRLLADKLHDLQLIVTMNNIRFAQLQVERLARECFFVLAQSFPFDESTFGMFFDPIRTTKPMQVCAPISYVFNLQPPTGVHSGVYAADLWKCLYGNSY